MKIRLLLSIALLCSAVSSNAQTSLAAGDISITGYSAGISNRDGLTFVPWVQLLAGTTIRFTFDAFNSGAVSTNPGNWRHNGNTMSWTTSSVVNAGTVIQIVQDGTGGSALIPNIGTITVNDANGGVLGNNAFLLSNDVESLFAFQSASVPSPANLTATFSGTLLYGIGWQGIGAATGWLTSGTSSGSLSYRPSDIASYGPFFASSSQGAEYTGARTGLATMALYKAQVNAAPTNWGLSLTGVNPFNVTAFVTIPLNVSLSSFTARNENGIAGLYWNTESEMENAGFEIERSNDGKMYRSIGFVSTKAVDGNSNGTLSYTFQDRNPVTSTHFYRLAQKDKSGKITYSTAVNVNFDNESGFVCYPNPVQGQMTLQYTLDKQEKLNIGITDVSGKVVWSKEANSAKGFNQSVIDLSGLAQGLYYMTVTSATGVRYTSRISKN